MSDPVFLITGASSGIGTPNHLGAEMLKYMAKIDIVHVAYKGGGPAMNDLIGGQVQLKMDTLATSASHIAAGKLRALAIASRERSAQVPDLPTVAELGPRRGRPGRVAGAVANPPTAVTLLVATSTRTTLPVFPAGTQIRPWARSAVR